MSTDTPSSVRIGTSAEPIASVPGWFGEVALLAHTLTRLGLLAEISERVHFARFREQIGERLAEMSRLGGKAVLFVNVEMSRHHSRLDPIVAVVDEHAFLHGFGAPMNARRGRDHSGSIARGQ